MFQQYFRSPLDAPPVSFFSEYLVIVVLVADSIATIPVDEVVLDRLGVSYQGEGTVVATCYETDDTTEPQRTLARIGPETLFEVVSHLGTLGGDETMWPSVRDIDGIPTEGDDGSSLGSPDSVLVSSSLESLVLAD